MTTLPPSIADLLDGDSKFEETTLQGYRSAWRDLLSWVRDNGPGERSRGDDGPSESNLDADELSSQQVPSQQPPSLQLPSPTLIAEYLRDRINLSWSTLATRRQAIRHVYNELGEEDPFTQPEVEKVWEQVVDEKSGKPTRQEKQRLADQDHSPADIIEKGPGLLRDHLPSEPTIGENALEYMPEETTRSEELHPEVQALIPEPTFDLAVLRDRAILLLIARTDRTRKSLVGIDLEDIRPPGEEGGPAHTAGPPHTVGPTRIVMYDSAGDPAGLLRLETEPEIRYCPNRAVAAWVLAAGLKTGPLFRPFNPHGGLRDGRIGLQTLNKTVKRWAEDAGFSADEWSTTTLRRQP